MCCAKGAGEALRELRNGLLISPPDPLPVVHRVGYYSVVEHPLGLSSPSSRPKLMRSLELLVYWQQRTWVFPLPAEGVVTIGRAPDNLVCIDNDSVSRYHAKLRVEGDLELQDLNAANGTFLHETVGGAGQTAALRPLSRASARVAVGQSITFGAVTAVIRHASPDFATGEPNGLGPGALVPPDSRLREVYAQAERAASANITVLVIGETGVGKELIARAIHAASPRSRGPFLAINCGALSESLLEGELFGSEKGAFTGATQTRPGLFESADGGTVLLDEVGELTVATQVKLLRVLEERAVLRVGARRTRPIDVRFVAATNRNLEAEVAAGTFREDLYFRLNGLTLKIPPLRERVSEIEPLARAFVAASCRQLERRAPIQVSTDALALLRAYRWPGNVRELKNVMERAVVLSSSSGIDVDHLPETLRLPQVPAPPRRSEPTPAADLTSSQVPQLEAKRFQAEIRSLERMRVIEALNRCAGNQTRAAAMLGISRRTLVSRLGEFALPRPRKPDKG